MLIQYNTKGKILLLQLNDILNENMTKETFFQHVKSRLMDSDFSGDKDFDLKSEYIHMAF